MRKKLSVILVAALFITTVFSVVSADNEDFVLNDALVGTSYDDNGVEIKEYNVTAIPQWFLDEMLSASGNGSGGNGSGGSTASYDYFIHEVLLKNQQNQEVDFMTNGGKIESVSIARNEVTDSVVLVIAQYNGQALSRLTTFSVTFSNDFATVLTNYPLMNLTDSSFVKLFVWDSLLGRQPYAAPYVLSPTVDLDVSINFLYGDAYYEKILFFGQTLGVETYIRNTTIDAKSVTLFVAEYDPIGKLIATHRNEDTIPNNGIYQSISVNVPLPSTNTTGYKIKAFVWEGVSLEPYVDSLPLTNTTTNDYHANTIGAANFVNDIKTIKGRINTTSDVDFVKFSPATTGDYIIAIQSAQALTGALYNDNNPPTPINQGTVSVAQGETYLKGSLTQNQVYYIKMSGSSTVADYTISVYKPTDGGTLTLNTAKNGSITSGNNFYKYSFTAPTARTYFFTSVGTTEIKGVLYNTSTAAPTIAYTRDGNVSFNITKTLAAGETCCLVVTPKTSGVTGAYSLYVEVPMNIASVQ